MSNITATINGILMQEIAINIKSKNIIKSTPLFMNISFPFVTTLCQFHCTQFRHIYQLFKENNGDFTIYFLLLLLLLCTSSNTNKGGTLTVGKHPTTIRFNNLILNLYIYMLNLLKSFSQSDRHILCNYDD